MGKENNRRKYFIKKGYQGRLLMVSLLLVAGGCLLFILLFSIFFSDVLTVSYIANGTLLSQTPLTILKNIVIQNWLTLTIGLGGVILLSTLLSHRIAGPMYRFERTLELMQQGNLNCPIRLRGKDEGKELANKINLFNLQLSQTLRSIRGNSQAINSLIDQIIGLEIELEKKEQLAGLCWSLTAHNKKISQACQFYQLLDKKDYQPDSGNKS